MDIEKDQLVKKYGLKISQLAHRMIHQKQLAEEAAQEVWFEIIKSIHSFKEKSDISTWIYTVARRTILRYSVRERTYSDCELNNHFSMDPVDYNGPEEEKLKWVKEQCDYCLTAFCHCLNNEARLIFLFRDIVGLSYPQISRIMELSEDNIRQITFRSREKVKNFMNKNCILYNPKGNCKCRIIKHVIAVDLDKSYAKLANAAKLVKVFQKSGKELPSKNYWEKFVVEGVTK